MALAFHLFLNTFTVTVSVFFVLCLAE